jgi:hypothetical protein
MEQEGELLARSRRQIKGDWTIGNKLHFMYASPCCRWGVVGQRTFTLIYRIVWRFLSSLATRFAFGSCSLPRAHCPFRHEVNHKNGILDGSIVVISLFVKRAMGNFPF